MDGSGDVEREDDIEQSQDSGALENEGAPGTDAVISSADAVIASADAVFETIEPAAAEEWPGGAESAPDTEASGTGIVEPPSGDAMAAGSEAADSAEAEPAEAEPERSAGEMMQEFFEDLMAAMGVQGTVRVKEDGPEQVTLDILNCPDASLIIGRHGQTVDDLQYLGSLILNNARRERKRFMLNVENYRERREEILRQSARELARQVAQRGQEAILDPLPPHERRIVHLALMDDPDIYTYSEGDEPDRRIVISPRNVTPSADFASEESPSEATASDEVPGSEPEAGPDSSEAIDQGTGEETTSSSGDESPEEVERDATEFGLTTDSSDDESTSSSQDGSGLPESTPGGGSHGGHTGAEPGE